MGIGFFFFSHYIVNLQLYLANVGDTRVVLNKGGKAVRLSFDHKPNSDEEEARIRALGGFVIGETSRVNGLLAVSRSIGDFYVQIFPLPAPIGFVDRSSTYTDATFCIR